AINVDHHTGLVRAGSRVVAGEDARRGGGDDAGFFAREKSQRYAHGLRVQKLRPPLERVNQYAAYRADRKLQEVAASHGGSIRQKAKVRVRRFAFCLLPFALQFPVPPAPNGCTVFLRGSARNLGGCVARPCSSPQALRPQPHRRGRRCGMRVVARLVWFFLFVLVFSTSAAAAQRAQTARIQGQNALQSQRNEVVFGMVSQVNYLKEANSHDPVVEIRLQQGERTITVRLGPSSF